MTLIAAGEVTVTVTREDGLYYVEARNAHGKRIAWRGFNSKEDMQRFVEKCLATYRGEK